MLKKLLAATAIATIASMAQAAEAVNTTAAPAATIMSGDMFLPAAMTGENLASRLIGKTIYDSEGQNAQAIGDINDLVIGADGQVKAVVVGVGGFLGIGEKNVAVGYNTLKWVNNGNETWLVAATTKEQLDQAPAFDMAALDTQTVPATPPADGSVPADQVATQQPSATDTMVAPDAGQMAAGDQTAPMTTAPMAQDLEQVDVATVSADELINTTVYSSGNENVGEVGDIVLADDGKIDAVVLDVGGFLGIGEKPVAIGFDALDIRRDANGGLYVYTKFSREQLEAAQAYDKDAWATQRDTMRLSNPS